MGLERRTLCFSPRQEVELGNPSDAGFIKGFQALIITGLRKAEQVRSCRDLHLRTQVLEMRKVREMIASVGGFFEVYVSTPLEVCEQRDRKGLYAKARAGVLKEFTGVSDPYEAPVTPELVLDAGHGSVDEEAEAILSLIKSAGFVA